MCTYIAKFKLALVDVTIVLSGRSSSDNTPMVVTLSGVSDKHETISLDVAFAPGTNQVTVKSIPVGTYSVTAKDGWAWRYDVDSADTNKYTSGNTTYKLTMKDNSSDLWLNGYGYKKTP